MKTERQRKNLREALVWWQTVPEENVYPNLSDWSKDDSAETNCGTVACFGGWCARWPGLIAQGLKLSRDGVPYIGREEFGFGRWIPLAGEFFGDDELWSERRIHSADTNFCGSDHALVTNRIRWALEQA